MKNSELIEPPLLNIERNALFMIIFIVFGIGLAYADYLLFSTFNPWGFIIMVPAAFMAFQSLWLILHPFALVFGNRIEIKHSLFSNKLWYFIDISKITQSKDGQLFITYKDGEVEKLNLFGIKKSEIPALKNEIEKNITLS